MLLGIQWMDPNWLLAQFGSEFFWISLAIVFVECGLLFPFLPGDTLLFAMGLFIATGKIDVFPGGEVVELLIALVLMIAAAFAGNAVGYEIGRKLGEPLRGHDGRIIKKKYLDKTVGLLRPLRLHSSGAGPLRAVRAHLHHAGGAGVTRMQRHRFLVWSLSARCCGWPSVTLAGYFLGSAFPSLGENIDKAMIVILAFSLIPIGIEWWRHRRAADASA